MANTYLNLPLPAGNGPGTAVNTSTMGAAKTITFTGNIAKAIVIIEVSVDGGTEWAPLFAFQGGCKPSLTTQISCNRMRTNVRNRTATFSANVDVAADDNGCDFDVVLVPALGVMFGAPVDVSAYGRYLTIICGGRLSGAIVEVQASEDGSSYVPIALFQDNALRMARIEFVAKFLRTKVTNRKAVVPFSATVALGASLFDVGTFPATPPPGPSTPKSYLPERWMQTEVPGTQLATIMSSGVSQIVDDFMVDRDCSVIGLVLRFDAVLTAGAAEAELTINGVASGFTVGVSAPNDRGYDVAAIGAFPVSAGDVVGATLVTTGMLPADSLSAEVTVEIADS